jgi:hypothetical protein
VYTLIELLPPSIIFLTNWPPLLLNLSSHYIIFVVPSASNTLTSFTSYQLPPLSPLINCHRSDVEVLVVVRRTVLAFCTTCQPQLVSIWRGASNPCRRTASSFVGSFVMWYVGIKLVLWIHLKILIITKF